MGDSFANILHDELSRGSTNEITMFDMSKLVHNIEEMQQNTNNGRME